MKKNNIVLRRSGKSSKNSKASSKKVEQWTIGLDLGDKASRFCVLGEGGAVKSEGSVATTRKAMTVAFAGMERCRIAIEVGTHSPWLSRLLQSLGHEVVVANPRQVKLIGASSRKNDRMDARTLARLARIDPELLRPIRHRSEKAQADLMVIRVRAELVEARTSLVNSARGLTKAMGERLPACDSDSLGVARLAALPAGMKATLEPLLEMVEELTEKIHGSDERIEQIARTDYPETTLLQQVWGVGPLIALTFVLTVDDAERFNRSRDVGCYVGLRPKQSDSGASQPPLRITKEGDGYLRKLLVQGAHCILSRRGPDTDLQRFGRKLSERGGKNAKKRAVVAVARKLAVLLHRLWVTGEVYEPLRNNPAERAKAA